MKRTILSMLCLCLAFVMLFAVGCEKGDGKASGEDPGNAAGEYDGTYYQYVNGSCIEASYILIRNGTWKAVGTSPASGKCVIENGAVSLFYTLDAGESRGKFYIEQGYGKEGDTIILFAGTLADGKLTLDQHLGQDWGEGTETFYLDGVVPEAS